MRGLDARAAAMIRIDAVWLAVHPTDMRAGADRLLARVVQVFGAAQAHHGYLFVNARSTRIKLLVHDGFVESLTFQLARLKAWKFGAKTERMNAEQRAIFEEILAADQSSLQTQLAALQGGAGTGHTPAEKPPRSQPKRQPLPAHRAQGHEMPDARVWTANGARGRRHQ